MQITTSGTLPANGAERTLVTQHQVERGFSAQLGLPSDEKKSMSMFSEPQRMSVPWLEQVSLTLMMEHLEGNYVGYT